MSLLSDLMHLVVQLVEKPFDGDDHNINIYYGFGKGSRRLFRKIKNKSSEAYPDEHDLRTDVSPTYSLSKC